ncbi:CK1/TTBK protein kinase [Pelomyxa schiedti]|nr:CK1/TTBK protein kinase [Pelomyxa schiedti]
MEVIDEKKQALGSEVVILKRLQGCPYVVQFITCGRHENFNFMAMQILGENLSDLRKRHVMYHFLGYINLFFHVIYFQRQGDGKFSLMTTVKLTLQMIEILQNVHERGVLHRDIKPVSNNWTVNPKSHSVSSQILSLAPSVPVRSTPVTQTIAT